MILRRKLRLLSKAFNDCKKYGTVALMSSNEQPSPKSFKLEKALIVTKLSRFEFEESRNRDLNSQQLENKLRSRGTDYEGMLCLHDLHKKFEMRIIKSFQDVGCDVKVINRSEFRTVVNKEILNWADVIVPIGGDGTFLLAAGRANPLFSHINNKIPVVGFNSDPKRSEGRLMLPKHYSRNPEEAVRQIKSGDFQWMHRSRIRTTLLGNNGKLPESIDLHGHVVAKMHKEKIFAEKLESSLQKKYDAKVRQVLPYLALNEVFIGEALSARVSHLQLSLDHADTINKTKCSGLCVSTGTGSTSWHTSINRITSEDVQDLLKILPSAVGEQFAHNLDEIADEFNDRLLFSPDDNRLCYSIREQISVGVWPNPKDFKSRGFVRSLFVKSKCIDASLVIDGSIAYAFNDGAKALLEIYPEDALLTMSIK